MKSYLHKNYYYIYCDCCCGCTSKYCKIHDCTERKKITAIQNLYFKDRKGNLYTKFTKEQIKLLINPYYPKTFLPFLKDMDYPYFEKEWGYTLARNINNPQITINIYIAKMNLLGFRSFTWKDSIYHKDLDAFCFEPYGINLKNGIYNYTIEKLGED